jgi:hypothetical protein
VVTPSPNETHVPTITFTRVPTSIFTPIPAIASLEPTPGPTQPTIAVITPDPAQLERWQEYEYALGKELLERELSRGKVVCEWEILGQHEQEVYVWVYCSSTTPLGETDIFPFSQTPAVIHLNEDSSIQSVERPGAGTYYARDIREMFPPDAQERYFDRLFDLLRLSERLRWRRKHPEEPPLIVISSTPLP